MIVCEPTLSFTIPSLHDELPLDCRIYHPSGLKSRAWRSTAVILAHPYAKLGGSYDVPVIHAATSALLEEGVTVGTFNFRGAPGSRGSTTWTGKAEVADYESFAAFVAYYLDALGLLDEESEIENRTSLSPKAAVMPIPDSFEKTRTKLSKISVVLGGYSYGSLVVRRLSPLDEILRKTACQAAPNAVAADKIVIIAKAQELALQFRVTQGENSESPHSARVFRLGEAPSPRQSHDSGRSAETPRDLPVWSKSMARGNKGPSASGRVRKSSAPAIPYVVPYYLLISPPLQLVSNLLMLPIGYKYSETETSAWTTRPTLAVFGDSDGFMAIKKLNAWARRVSAEADKKFEYIAIAGAGHFWMEQGVLQKMQESLRLWVRSTVLQGSVVKQ